MSSEKNYTVGMVRPLSLPGTIRQEAIAVLRGEMQWHLDAMDQRTNEDHLEKAIIHQRIAAALGRAINVLNGNAQPRGKYNGEV